MTLLDTLTRKVEENHDEILQVQSEVVAALRSFYASSSTISADEAVKIAATWGASHAFPMDGADADASDLQEKMRRLNVALLDAVDRLQLDKASEMAPEAQQMHSLIQRERLEQQVQQSKTMLTIIEQLTEMDRLFGAMDEASDRYDFVAAAEGIAEAERLVQELEKSETDQSDNGKDRSIVSVVAMQLQSKKNHLLHELSKYLACTLVWQENAVTVVVSTEKGTIEPTKGALGDRRLAVWKAYEVLEMLSLRMNDLAKQVSQCLIQPMVRTPRGRLQQLRNDSSMTLHIVPRDEHGITDHEQAEVPSQCANVVSLLEFVHAHVFADNAELMTQFGEFMWKTPGKLEAQLLNLLEEHIPQDGAALDAYREEFLPAIIELETKLVAMGFLACRNSELRSFVDQLSPLHLKRRRQAILSNGRDLIRLGYQDSVKIEANLEKCSLTRLDGSRKKGHEESSAGSVRLNLDDVESSCFQVPEYRVSVCAHKLVEVVHETLLEACTASASNAKALFHTARDLFLLFRAIAPTLYKEEVANDPRTCMLYHNDCLYMTYHMVMIGQLYKHRLPVPLNQTATMVDMIPPFKFAGERALTLYASTQVEELQSGFKLLPSLDAIHSDYDSKRVETFLNSTLYKLNTICSSWYEGLPLAVYNKVMSRMLEPLVKKFVDGVLTQTTVAENTRAHLHHLLSLVGEFETLFVSPTQAAKFVPSLERLLKLTSMLMDPLATVRDKFNSSNLDVFSSKELAVLVKSLFRDSPERSAFLKELLRLETTL